MTFQNFYRILFINLMLIPLVVTATPQNSGIEVLPEIVIQEGMLGHPSHISLSHKKSASFMEVFREDGEQLWRKQIGDTQWRVLRRWANRARSASHRHHGKVIYSSVVHDGKLDLYDSDTWALVHSVKTPYKVHDSPSIYFGPDGLDYRILKIPTFDRYGRKAAQLWFSHDGKEWVLVNKLLPVETFSEIRAGYYFGKSHADEYRIYQATNQGLIEYSKLPTAFKRIDSASWLSKNLFAIGERVKGLAKSFDLNDKGIKWKLYSWHKGKGWRSVQSLVGKPELIRNFSRIGNGYFSIKLRGIQSAEPLHAERIYHVNEEGHIRRLADMEVVSPLELGQFVALANGDVIGMREHDDQDKDGVIGSWQWRMRSASGWSDLAQILPDQTARILRVVDWLHGEGLGIQSIDRNAKTSWHWLMRNKSGIWEPMSAHILGLASVAVTRVDEMRDGLIGFVEGGRQAKSPQVGSRISLAAKKVHWFVHAGDDSWQSVDRLLGKLHPQYVNHIVSIDARENVLMIKVEPNPGDPLISLILYRQRDGNWHNLDVSFYQANLALADIRLLPRAKANVDINAGVVLLEREMPETWFVGKGAANQQILYRKGKQWYLMPGSNQGGNAPLVYDTTSRILVRTSSVPEQRTYFLLDGSNGWRDLRKLVPAAPKVIASAYSFLNGRGVAIQEYRDSKKDGKIFQWSFYLKTADSWQPLESKLPGIGAGIQSVIEIGHDALSIQFEGRWQYFSVTGKDEWFNIGKLLSGLPKQLDSVHVSRDGKVLVVREEWDANKNGISWEVFVAVRNTLSERFRLLNDLLPEGGKLMVNDAKSLWRGNGVALEIGKTGEAVRVSSDFIEESSWHFYIWQHGKLKEAKGVPQAKSYSTSRDGSQIALQDVDGVWKLFGRKGNSLTYAELKLPALKQIRDIAFDSSTDYLGVKVSDILRDGEDRWQWYSVQGEVNENSLGYTSAGFWWGRASINRQGGRTRFESVIHSQDGQTREDVPTPDLWIHADAKLGNKGNMIYAPEFLHRVLHMKQQSGRIAIEALGIGREGSVILYRFGDKRFATAFSNGKVDIESHPLAGKRESQRKSYTHLLVNHSKNGLLRLVRMDQPERWLWGYGKNSGMIYFDNEGHFYSDSDSISQKISFRKDMDIYSISQFGNLLFRPDLLETTLGLPTGSLFEMTQRDKERMNNAVALANKGVDLKNAQPPTVAIAKVPSETNNPYVEIKLRADGFGIDEGSILINILGSGRARGEVVRGKGSKQVKISVSKKVPLVRGLNIIKLSVYDANGLESTKYIRVSYNPKNVQKPTLWAALIATRDYTSPRFARLPLTQNDAKTIRKMVQQQSGKMFDHVELKSWCQSENCDFIPTRESIVSSLPAFLQQAKNGDYIEIFVSGHGLKLEGEFYIVPSNGNLERKDSLVSWSEIQAWLQSAALGKKIVFLDTCKSGAVFGSGQNKRRLIQQAMEDDGIYVLSATAENASAYELKEMGNGLFTYVINEGLNGKADANSDGRISFEDFSFFIARRVRELSTLHQVRMEPDLPILNSDMDFELASIDRKKRLFFNVVDMASFDGTASPERLKFWLKQLSGIGIMVVDVKTDASIRLNVVENDGDPLRAQLTESNNTVLEQWSFKQTKQNSMLAELKVKVGGQE